jgi:septal ring factor EnvC (AmiA/AmiB activator)
MKTLFCLIFGLMILSGNCYAQNSAAKIKESREKTLKEIEYANKLLLETQGKAKESLNEVNIINHRLAKRKEYLLGLEVEMNVLSDAIEGNLKDISRAELEINKIKRMYAMMVVSLYKKKSNRYKSMYILAAENVNQLYKRIHTIKLYNKYLRTERGKLEKLKLGLQENNVELEKLKSEKDAVVNKTKKETLVIQREINDKNQIVRQLKKRQKEIEQEIRDKEKTANKLEAELKKVIDEERKKLKAKGSKEIMTPEEKVLSADFEKNTGRLPWPTQKGIITGQYGEHQHPDYKGVVVRNDGVYITTAAGESARAIFKGVVSRVFSIPGENYTVIIKHGKYFSLYHNLINVRVKAGQIVSTKETIGTVFTDSGSKETVLYFQIWKETERNNPELWLAPL